MRVWTVGHSTRSLDELAGLLEAHGVQLVADVRRFPASRRHPQFERGALEAGLRERGIGYVWLGEALGGRRKLTPEAARHSALRNPSFRGYAAYMETAAFEAGMARLLELAAAKRTAVMCAESLWWRCHRSMISDWLAARGHEVLHILSDKPAGRHKVKAEARVEGGRLVYDAAQPALPLTPARQQTVPPASKRGHGTDGGARL